MLLALTLINPFLLYAGAALASIPVILHLLNRRRFKRVVWAAMEFLLAAHRKNARRVRIEQIILLIIRTLIILLLAAALARPVLQGFLAGLGRSAVHRVLVLDDSFSMSAQQGLGVDGDTAVKEAKAAARWLMESFDKRDGLSLLTIGSLPHGKISAPSYDHEQVLQKIENLQASDSATDMIATLEEVKKIVTESQFERKVVYLITDNTKSAWAGDAARTLAGLAPAIAEKAGLIVVDVGRPDRPNLALRALDPERPVVTTEISSTFRLEVENLSNEEVADVIVNMAVDGQKVGPVSFGKIAAHKTESRKWSWRFERAGDHTIAATLGDSVRDAVAADSVRFLAVNVQQALNIMLVDGEPKPGFFQGETSYLRVALDPRLQGEQRQTPFNVINLRDTELNADRFGNPDVAVLANVASLTGEQQTLLERFVRDGGSLLIFLGGQVRIEDYNRNLYAAGKGLLPASLSAPVGSTEPGRSDKFVSFDVGHFDHPALAAFKVKAGGTGFDNVRVQKYYPLKLPPEAQDVSMILKFQDATGGPAIVEKKFGRGRVVLAATTADVEWTNLPLVPVFLELVHELMNYLTPDVLWRYNRVVDSETAIPVPVALSRQSFAMQRPNYSTVALQPTEAGQDSYALAIKELGASGIYTIEWPGAVKRHLAVNVDTRESDLQQIGEPELRQQLGFADFVYAKGVPNLKEVLAAQQSAGGWARNLLYAVLGLLFLETLLAWLFNRGT